MKHLCDRYSTSAILLFMKDQSLLDAEYVFGITGFFSLTLTCVSPAIRETLFCTT